MVVFVLWFVGPNLVHQYLLSLQTGHPGVMLIADDWAGPSNQYGPFSQWYLISFNGKIYGWNNSFRASSGEKGQKIGKLGVQSPKKLGKIGILSKNRKKWEFSDIFSQIKVDQTQNRMASQHSHPSCSSKGQIQ